MRIIPAIDIINGKCVRLTKGDYNQQKTYHENPIEVAKMFQDYGFNYLHLVDLDGAKSHQIVNYKILEQIATQANLQIDFGGGIKTEEDVKIAFDAGAKQITIGSIAALNPELMLNWVNKYGPEKIILGADCKNRKIATQGWLTTSDLDVVDFISYYTKNNITHCIVTDIEKDGMLNGPANSLYKEIISKTNINLIASGGVTTINDVIEIKKMGCEGVIIGKAIYEQTINLNELLKLC